MTAKTRFSFDFFLLFIIFIYKLFIYLFTKNNYKYVFF